MTGRAVIHVHSTAVDAASAQALAQFIADGVAVVGIAGLAWQIKSQNRQLSTMQRQLGFQQEEVNALRAERERLARQQAERVDVESDTFTKAPDGVRLGQDEQVYGVEIVNRTGRPIHKVYAGIRDDGQNQYGYAAARILTVTPQVIGIHLSAKCGSRTCSMVMATL